MRGRVLTARQVFDILARQAETAAPFGQVAIDAGHLTEANVYQLLQEQRRQTPELGQILVELGLLDPAVAHEERQIARTVGTLTDPMLR